MGVVKQKRDWVYKVSEWCVYDWCKKIELEPKKPSQRRKRKLDWEALRHHVQKYQSCFAQRESRVFRRSYQRYLVWDETDEINSQKAVRPRRFLICQGTRTKTKHYSTSREVTASELNTCKSYATAVLIYGSSSLVYIDESGFELETFRPFAVVATRTESSWRNKCV